MASSVRTSASRPRACRSSVPTRLHDGRSMILTLRSRVCRCFRLVTIALRAAARALQGALEQPVKGIARAPPLRRASPPLLTRLRRTSCWGRGYHVSLVIGLQHRGAGAAPCGLARWRRRQLGLVPTAGGSCEEAQPPSRLRRSAVMIESVPERTIEVTVAFRRTMYSLHSSGR